MRFRLRFQNDLAESLRLFWPLAGLALAVTALAIGRRAPSWISGALMFCWIVMLLNEYFSYCQFGADGLVLRRRGRKTLIPYNSLIELKARTDAYGVLAVTDAGRRIPIPVAQTPLFLRDAYRRFPGLNPASGSQSLSLIA